MSDRGPPPPPGATARRCDAIYAVLGSRPLSVADVARRLGCSPGEVLVALAGHARAAGIAFAPRAAAVSLVRAPR